MPSQADPVEVNSALATLRDHALLTEGSQLALAEAARGAWPQPLNLGVPVVEITRHATAHQLREYVRKLGLKPATRKADLLTQALGAWRDPALVRRWWPPLRPTRVNCYTKSR